MFQLVWHLAVVERKDLVKSFECSEIHWDETHAWKGPNDVMECQQPDCLAMLFGSFTHMRHDPWCHTQPTTSLLELTNAWNLRTFFSSLKHTSSFLTFCCFFVKFYQFSLRSKDFMSSFRWPNEAGYWFFAENFFHVIFVYAVKIPFQNLNP